MAGGLYVISRRYRNISLTTENPKVALISLIFSGERLWICHYLAYPRPVGETRCMFVKPNILQRRPALWGSSRLIFCSAVPPRNILSASRFVFSLRSSLLAMSVTVIWPMQARQL